MTENESLHSGSRWEPPSGDGEPFPADRPTAELHDPAPQTDRSRAGNTRRATLAGVGAGLFLIGGAGGFAIGHAAGGSDATGTTTSSFDQNGPASGGTGEGGFGQDRTGQRPDFDGDGDRGLPPGGDDGQLPGNQDGGQSGGTASGGTGDPAGDA